MEEWSDDEFLCSRTLPHTRYPRGPNRIHSFSHHTGELHDLHSETELQRKPRRRTGTEDALVGFDRLIDQLYRLLQGWCLSPLSWHVSWDTIRVGCFLLLVFFMRLWLT
jgi:hypothetical protein